MNVKPEKIEKVIPSNLELLCQVEMLTETVAKSMDFSDDEKDNLAIAVTEAVGNAIVHGNKKDSKKKVFITFWLTPKEVKVRVRDQGKGFDPEKLSNPLDPENVMKESGRGIFILKALMDEVEFSDGGTVISFVMKKKAKVK
jgi:serine/threonine-protein kinase RsbW